MTEFFPVDDDSAWRHDWARRVVAHHRDLGLSPSAAIPRIERCDARLAGADASVVAAIHEGDVVVGYVVAAVMQQDGARNGRIEDVWVAPEHRGRGHGTAARQWAQRWCAVRGAQRYVVEVLGPSHLFADYPLRAQRMVKTLTVPPTLAAGVSHRPMTQQDFDGWLAGDKAGYVDDIVDSGSMSRAAAWEKAERDFQELLPEGLQSPEHTFWTVCAGDVEVGWIWLRHGFTEDQSYVFSVSVAAEHRGKGYGRAAMSVGERASLAAGDRLLGLNVFGHNAVAINLYNSLGYAVLDQSRSVDVIT